MKEKISNPNIFRRTPQKLKVENTLFKTKSNNFPFIEEIQTKEELLNLQSIALEAAANGIVITNKKGKIQWINPGFTKLTGYSKEEAFGNNLRMLKSEKHNNEFYKNLWTTIKVGNIWSGIIINKKKDGTCYHEEMTITPVKNSIGKITNYIAIKQDVTDSRYKLKQLIENSTLGIMRLEPDGKINMVNPALVLMLGYNSASEIISLTDNEIYLSLKNKNEFLETLRREQKIKSYKDIFVKKDRTHISVKESAWIVKDQNKNPMYYEVIVEDITELNQTLESLHESEQKYRTLIDKLNEAVYLIIDQKFEIVNSKFMDLLEVTEDELNKSNFNIFNFISDDSKKIVIERKIKAERGEEVPSHYEMRIVTKNGNEKEVEVSETFVKFSGKIATQGVVRDLTKIRKAETQIRHLQKMEAIGTLAAGIAHEINTPCQFVNDNLSFLQEVHKDLNPIFELLKKINQEKINIDELKQLTSKIDIKYLQEEIPEAIEQSLDGVQRVTNIVGAMRDFSYARPKEKIAADIHQLIENSITISRNTWKYIANIETDFDDSIPPIICLASSLGQVFVNIIVNASHALEEKFNDSETLSGKIIIKTILKDKSIEIIFSDNGIGMTKEIQKRIYDPFFTTKDVNKGTGQGLAIAYDIIVDKHNGNIEVESEKNIGTKFTITLPIENT